MPDELGNFQTTGPTWQERAEQGVGVAAVYSPDNLLRSQWLSLVNSISLKTVRNHLDKKQVALDFGCGIGHLTYMLSQSAGITIGLDITPGMLQRAQNTYGDAPITFGQIDGIHLPLGNNSIDLIWVCGVLRYSLLVPEPKHKEIVDEFFRVLKPGGRVYNLEMYVDLPSSVFSKDFLGRGFRLLSTHIVNIHSSIFDRVSIKKYPRFFLRNWWARFTVEWVKLTASEHKLRKRRDYFFEYQKPIIW